MSFPKYPKYKDSGVEWLGEVPEQWPISRLKYIATHNDDVLDESTPPDYEIAYVDISSVDALRGIHTKESMRFTAAPSRARRRVQHGDIIVSTVRTYLKAIARIRQPEDNLIVSTGFAVIRPRNELLPSFAGFLLSSGYFLEQVIARSTGVSYPAINASDLVAIEILTPPREEQTAIAAFLDLETAKIDALVAEQQRLIELLKEKRQAVISHVVTKGLNSRTPMKPSGVEWLGEIPKTWDVQRLKRLVYSSRRITYGIVQPGESDPSGRFMIRGKDYSSGWCQRDEIFRVADAIEIPYTRSRMRVKDLVITIVGAGVGNVALIPDWLDGANITQTTARIAIDQEKALPEFVWYALRGIIGQRNLERNVYGSAQPRLNIEHVDAYLMTVPPIEEQRQIVEFLERELNQFDTLTTEAQRAIDLLQERRTALISAAVTGKIDVRGLAQTEAA